MFFARYIPVLLAWLVYIESDPIIDPAADSPLTSDLGAALRILDAIQRMVNYYEQHYAQINLDGIYGLRVMQGQLLFFKDYEPLTDESVKSKIVSLYDQVTEIANKSLNTLMSLDRSYYDKMKFLVNQPQLTGLPLVYRRVSTAYLWNVSVPILDREFYTEDESDHCVSLLTESPSQMPDLDPDEPIPRDPDNCNTTDQCLRFMFTEGAIGYTLTHQLLYTLMVQQYKCVDKIEPHLSRLGFPSKTISRHQVALCSNNFFEVSNHVVANEGVVDDAYQDLFLEQLFVCPVLGFAEFLHHEWSDLAIDWQSEDGCFRDKQIEFSNYKSSVPGRTILKEKELSDGCLSHKMAVALAMFSQSLHFALHPGISEEFRLDRMHFNGVNRLKQPNAIHNKEEIDEIEINQTVDIVYNTSIPPIVYVFCFFVVFLIYKLFKYIKRNRIVIHYRKSNHLVI